MTKQQFLDFLAAADFASLFNEAGWNCPASNRPLRYEIGAGGPAAVPTGFVFNEIAELFVRVFVCEVESLPQTAVRNALDARLRKLGDSYIAIFVKKGEPMHHLWMVPVKAADKRSLVRIEYQERAQADFLFGKFQEIQFTIGSSPSAVDVLDRLNKVFQVNSTDVTKKFYREFRIKHNAFVKGIIGIMDKSDCEWYASVMLNRLMFCYFIQKKGFLNLDPEYLTHKLSEVQEKKGEDKFYGTFYKDFLRVLFADGLNKRTHSKAFEDKFGRIPYLNGGMLEVHKLEMKYPDIDIPDSVFEDLFVFFDQWRWHLDTSITASGKDINPDVLGYIFEQYINDRAKMGAYYTKEDITEYIARNTLVPWLVCETAKKSPAAFKPNGFVWQFLRESGDSYIFPAVRKGVDLPLPDEIEKGVAVEPQETLRARRAGWNKPAASDLALPTEIWRETVARRQRCQELRGKIAAGEIADINDFITFNLDIRSFVEDLLSKTTDHFFVRHFYDALSRVTVLDPTCGSGAFLFAALNILEPLYEICLTRMQEDWPEKFKDELSALKTKYRGNLKYCIYKSIILRNLYGVDIMREATEIARLRLFLKMVAVVDVDDMADNLGLDPLPDIDFNIRCGNTLVGFANPQGVKDAILPPDELALDTEAYDKVEAKAADISDLYERFKSLQQTAEGSPEFYDAKKKLNAKLAALNDELDRAIAYRQYGISPEIGTTGTTATSAPQSQMSHQSHQSHLPSPAFLEWKRKTQPFHWYSEFYGITVANGGFDVIIGNPPYVEYSKVKDYKICGYKTESCGNLYAFVAERAEAILSAKGRRGMIIPHSAICTDRMKPLFDIFVKAKGWFSTYDTRPSKLFDGVDQRLLIYLLGGSGLFSTNYRRWNEEARNSLFETIHYTGAVLPGYVSISKFESALERSIYEKVCRLPQLYSFIAGDGKPLYYHNAPRYFLRFTDTPPYFYSDRQGESISVQVKNLLVANNFAVVAVAYNSSLFYWWFACFSDCRHLLLREIESFHIPNVDFPEGLVNRLFSDYKKNANRKETFYKATGRVVYDEYYPKLSKPIIDKIDELLAKHYGFTEEELDFIINYDIKYRMGDKLNEGCAE
ncbi:MAG: Eco57I restriction-modification methylase domain-containing protein [Kiritimatiellae bacterium]|nr:Eco57I restriction-modification methylase domain-containing protein [Kiritimatiellia bacterium]